MAHARSVQRNGRTADRDRRSAARASGSEVRRTAENEARTVAAATGVKTAVAIVPSAPISRAGTGATNPAVVAERRP